MVYEWNEKYFNYISKVCVFALCVVFFSPSYPAHSKKKSQYSCLFHFYLTAGSEGQQCDAGGKGKQACRANCWFKSQEVPVLNVLCRGESILSQHFKSWSPAPPCMGCISLLTLQTEGPWSGWDPLPHCLSPSEKWSSHCFPCLPQTGITPNWGRYRVQGGPESCSLDAYTALSPGNISSSGNISEFPIARNKCLFGAYVSMLTTHPNQFPFLWMNILTILCPLISLFSLLAKPLWNFDSSFFTMNRLAIVLEHFLS